MCDAMNDSNKELGRSDDPPSLAQAIKKAIEIIVDQIVPLFPLDNYVSLIVRNPEALDETLLITPDNKEELLKALQAHVEAGRKNKLTKENLNEA